MTDAPYDDGLVHNHSWSYAHQPAKRDTHPIANVAGLRTPSTAAHDDHLFRD